LQVMLVGGDTTDPLQIKLILTESG